MVQEFMNMRTDLTRAAQEPVVAIANDLLEDLERELLAELIPEGANLRIGSMTSPVH